MTDRLIKTDMTRNELLARKNPSRYMRLVREFLESGDEVAGIDTKSRPDSVYYAIRNIIKKYDLPIGVKSVDGIAYIYRLEETEV